MGSLVNQLMKDGVIVFSFLNYFNTDRISPDSGNVFVVIPAATADGWADRIRKRGDSEEFVETVRSHFDQWVSDWVDASNALGNRLTVIRAPITAKTYLYDAILNLENGGN